jgi:EVE domain
MPGSHWMIVMSPENFEITRSRGVDVLGLKSRHRKKAERMAMGDRVLFYVSGDRVFPATATVASTFFEDHAPIWVSTERRTDVAPWRVKLRPDVSLNWYEYLDARQIAPRMLYVKRWAPEDWPLAFQGQVHLLSSQDFTLIEHEMRRTNERRSRRREQPPRRPRELVLSSGAVSANGAAPPATSPIWQQANGHGNVGSPPTTVEQAAEV